MSGQRPVALITGAGRGLGRELARAFKAEGYDLLLVVRQEADARSLAAETVVVDLADDQAPDKIIDELTARFGRLDVLINNAAVHGPVGRLESLDQREWDRALKVDLLAPVSLCRRAVGLMKKSGRGRIINLSGGGASGPRPRFTAYATAKAGLVRFSETLAAELAGSGLTVNCVAPGAMKTGLLAEIESLGAEVAGESELAGAEKVWAGDGDSLAAAVRLCLFLASPAADRITGKLISAVWDNYQDWPDHLEELAGDLYTLRRVTGRDRGLKWGDR